MYGHLNMSLEKSLARKRFGPCLIFNFELFLTFLCAVIMQQPLVDYIPLLVLSIRKPLYTSSKSFAFTCTISHRIKCTQMDQLKTVHVTMHMCLSVAPAIV